MATLELPHWLMIGGAVLILAGFIGLAASRKKEVETGAAGSEAEDAKSGASQTE